MTIYKKHLKLYLLFFLQACSASIHSKWVWYQPAPVLYREPSAGENLVTGVVTLGACVGVGIAAIVERRAKKKKFKEYIYTFRNMGYSKEQAQIYAQMAMNNPEGLQAVVRSIDQANSIQSCATVQHELANQTHSNKLEEMSHEYKLKLLTYLVTLLSSILLVGVGFLFYRKR